MIEKEPGVPEGLPGSFMLRMNGCYFSIAKKPFG